MDSEAPWQPLGILLSMYGSRINSKLLFKYPSKVTNLSRKSSYQQLSSSTFHLNNPNHGHLNIENADNESDVDIQQIHSYAEQLLGFSDECLGQLLSPGNTKICGQNFDVKINGLRFVGFPLVPEKSNLDGHPIRSLQCSMKNSGDVCPTTNTQLSSTTILAFNVVFVVRTNADYSIIESYQQLAAKIGLGLRFEEIRDKYLTKETKIMLGSHEECDASTEDVHKQILKRSLLAKNLKYIFHALSKTGIVDFFLNENIWITFCVYHKIHNSMNVAGNYADVKITAVEESLTKIQPYHGILVFNIKNVWDSLKPASSSTIVKFLNVYKPTKSLQLISTDADISLSHVYTVARHLVHWGKACVIYPLCETNVYVLAPTATLWFLSKWVEVFHDTFQTGLMEVLSHFSQPVRLGDLQLPMGPFFGHEKHLLEMIFWMLQHRFLVQHHTYVYFLPPTKETPCNERDVYNLFLSLKSEKFLFDFGNLPQICQTILHHIPASHCKSDLGTFLKLMPYLDGKHHLEEMMYRENIMRPELLTILEKFKPLLLTAVREDEIASAFCMRT